MRIESLPTRELEIKEDAQRRGEGFKASREVIKIRS